MCEYTYTHTQTYLQPQRHGDYRSHSPNAHTSSGHRTSSPQSATERSRQKDDHFPGKNYDEGLQHPTENTFHQVIVMYVCMHAFMQISLAGNFLFPVYKVFFTFSVLPGKVLLCFMQVFI
jgi:hypothetical protein